MTKEAVASLPAFQRLETALKGLSTELHAIRTTLGLDPEDMGLFVRPEALYDMVLDHASDVITQREALAKLTPEEKEALRASW
jgi:glutathionylspermidine synthase